MEEATKSFTIENVVAHKRLTQDQVKQELKKVMRFKQGETMLNSFVGNNLLYHFQMEQLCNTKRRGKLSFSDICKSDDAKKELIKQMEKRRRTGTWENRLFECWRINSGSITFFKMCSSTYLYKKYKATKVLDFTAGWGGRLLGALNLGIDYIGYDTNINLKTGYDELLALIKAAPPQKIPKRKKCKGTTKQPNEGVTGSPCTSSPSSNGGLTGSPRLEMIYQDCRDADFAPLDYDFVLTSPPYEDIEIYENMPAGYNVADTFYKEFLIPMIDKCRQHIKRDGWVAINISPQMYKKLTGKYNYPKALQVEDLKEQKNGKTPDNIYLWK